MPTYEYRCPVGHEFELFQRMSDEPRAPCPTCGEEAARLLSAGAGFLFKGDGFYITDYRSDSYRAAAKKDGDSGSGGGKGSSEGDGAKAPREPGPAASDASAASPGGSAKPTPKPSAPSSSGSAASSTSAD